MGCSSVDCFALGEGKCSVSGDGGTEDLDVVGKGVAGGNGEGRDDRDGCDVEAEGFSASVSAEGLAEVLSGMPTVILSCADTRSP